MATRKRAKAKPKKKAPVDRRIEWGSDFQYQVDTKDVHLMLSRCSGLLEDPWAWAKHCLKGMSDVEVSEATDIPRSTVRGLRNGRDINPKYDLLRPLMNLALIKELSRATESRK